MTKIHHVSRARQRYHRKPVLDDRGELVLVPVMKQRYDRDGHFELVPALSPDGRPLYRQETVRDLNDPKPMPVCERCGSTIEAGQPYKWMKPSVGPRAGQRLVRCRACPEWTAWDATTSISGRIQRLQIEYSVVDDLDPSAYARQVEALARAVDSLAADWRGYAETAVEPEDRARFEEEAEDLSVWAERCRTVVLPELAGDDPESLAAWRVEAGMIYEDALLGSPL